MNATPPQRHRAAGWPAAPAARRRSPLERHREGRLGGHAHGQAPPGDLVGPGAGGYSGRAR